MNLVIKFYIFNDLVVIYNYLKFSLIERALSKEFFLAAKQSAGNSIWLRGHHTFTRANKKATLR